MAKGLGLFTVGLFVYSLSAQAENRVTIYHAQRAQAQKILQTLNAHGDLKVVWNAFSAFPSMIRNLHLQMPGKTYLERARAFFQRYPALFSSSTPDLRMIGQQATHNRRVLRFQQHLQGIPVVPGWVNITMDSTGSILAVASDLAPCGKLSTTPGISESQALQIARKKLDSSNGYEGKTQAASAGKASLIILSRGKTRLAYQIIFPISVDPLGRAHLVDAHSGEYLGWRKALLVDGFAGAKGVRP